MSDPARDLPEQDREILRLEAEHWKYRGAKEAAIRARLGLHPVHYYQRLNVLADDPAAIAYAPMVTARVRRARGR